MKYFMQCVNGSGWNYTLPEQTRVPKGVFGDKVNVGDRFVGVNRQASGGGA